MDVIWGNGYVQSSRYKRTYYSASALFIRIPYEVGMTESAA